MTMGASKVAFKRPVAFKLKRYNSGQSLVEFAFLIPIVIGMLLIMVQVEEAISTAIVNQKYANAAIHYFKFNHRYFFEKHFSLSRAGTFMGRFWMGIDDRLTGQEFDEDEPSSRQTPRAHAPLRKIGILKGSEDPQTEYPDIDNRQNVRIRVTSFTCLPPLGLNSGTYLSEGNMGEDTFSGRYQYCTD